MACHDHPSTGLKTILMGLCLFLLAPHAGFSKETWERYIVSVQLNTQAKGDFFIFLTPERDIWVKKKDLLSWGVNNFTGNSHIIDGEEYLSLKSIRGLVYKFKEEDSSLNVQVEPHLLQMNIMDFSFRPQRPVFYPKGQSAFLNYSITWSDSLKGRDNVSLSTETGLRSTDWLFLSNFLYRARTENDRFLRLSSSLTHENKEKLLCLTLGDSYAASGIGGSSVDMGGISLVKNYALNPYYIKTPTFDYKGYVTLPSEMELYINEMLVRKEKLSPGQFNLKNLPLISGLNNMKVVLRDAFGRETVVSESPYYTDELLKKSEQEYNYHAGFLRKGYGVESNNYGQGVFLFSHRLGLSDDVTIGIRGEGKEGLINGGLTSTFRAGSLGITGIALSLSSFSGVTGGSLLGTHSFSGPGVTIGLSGKFNQRNWATLTADSHPQFEGYASLGFQNLIPDSVNINYGRTQYYDKETTDRIIVTYSKTIGKNLYLTLTASRILENRSDTQIYLNLLYYPWKESNLSTSVSIDRLSKAGNVTFQKNPSWKSDDFSYRLSASISHLGNEGDNKTLTGLNPYLKLNKSYGSYELEYDGKYEGTKREEESYRLTFSGALLYAEGQVGISSPVYDSFGIVKVGDLKDVRVLLNHQEAGKTDKRGKAIIPYLRSNIDNYVSINDKDIPINYAIKSVGRWINTHTRGGVFVPFEITKTQAFAGKIKIREKGVSIPLENVNIKVKVQDRIEVVPVTTEGEFYFENIPPGEYRAEFLYHGKRAYFKLRVPESNEFFVPLGVIELEMD